MKLLLERDGLLLEVHEKRKFILNLYIQFLREFDTNNYLSFLISRDSSELDLDYFLQNFFNFCFPNPDG